MFAVLKTSSATIKFNKTLTFIIMTISKQVQKLSYQGCIAILKDLQHVSMNSFDSESQQENYEFMQQVIQINLNEGLLDEIELLLILSGE